MKRDFETEIQAQTAEKFVTPKILFLIFEWLEAIVSAFIVVVLFFTLIFRVVAVDGQSMYPTLDDGNRLIIHDAFYKPKCGDIIVIANATSRHVPIIKRVIGVGGDTVEIDYTDGTVIVNGEPLVENYIRDPIAPIPGHEFIVEVPANHVFVLGDNRNQSDDSRAPNVGMIGEELIMGKAIFRFFPLPEFGRLY